MKLLIALLLMTATAQANGDFDELYLADINNCNGVIKNDSEYMFVGYNKHSYEDGKYIGIYQIANKLKTSQNLHFTTEDGQPIVDIERVGNKLYILTKKHLLVRSLDNYAPLGMYNTHNQVAPEDFARKQNPTGLARVDDILVISHGRLGYSVFDLDSKQVVFSSTLVDAQLPLESVANDVKYINEQLVFVMDNYTLVPDRKSPPLRGFVVLDLNSRKEKHLKFFSAGATSMSIDGDDLYVFFQGFTVTVKYSVARVLGSAAGDIVAVSRSWRYPQDKYGSNRGKVLVENGKVYTCFRQTDDEERFYNIRRIFSLDDLNWTAKLSPY